ncbi:MAG: ribosome recycling factor [Bacteroidota bacterium]|nr:ribosome recycling factor [Candidatus Kapabacteria bacterium]MDW8220003.1 ribosome recycling factor [Bacteroidota bacterium]
MPVQDVIAKAQAAMKKTTDHLQQEFAKVRTGRATVTILDPVRVEYYGSSMPLNQVASLSVPDPRTIVIQPFEKAMLSPIEKAIREADLGLNPSNDGNVVRVPIPMLTEERRKEIVKMCKKFAEESRVAIRNIRRDHNELLKKIEKEEHLSEDERKRGEQEIQKVTDRFIKLIDDMTLAKEKEVMAV